jgi:hypothetical protein
LQRTIFQCEADAQAALDRLGEQLPWHRPQAEIVAVKKYAKPGRPAQDAVAQIVGWQATGQLTPKQKMIERARQWLGRFIGSPAVFMKWDLTGRG